MTEETGGPGLEGERKRTIDALCEDFAQDAIGMDDFERRVDLAHKAGSLADLRELLADLPAGRQVVPSQGAAPVAPQAPVPGGLVQASLASGELVRERQLVFSLLGGSSRKGAWTPARHVYCINILGGIQLDFREARFAPGVTEVSVFSKLGGVDIIVPPGLQVDFGGIGILGGFDMSDEVTGVKDPSAPILRVNGLAILGGVDVTVRQLGESAREARHRRRARRKERKMEQKRLRGGLE
jgi:hypothetical protein